jgi:antitoxin component YwqK of YwqJK toxin-antitoxin module
MKTSIIFLSLIFLFFSCSELTTTDEVKENVEVNKTTGDQIPDGEFIQKYPSGAVQIKGEMSNNECVDLWTAYYENGMKQSESMY